MKKKNSGGSTSFYDIPKYVHNVDSLARYLKITGPLFNILKSIFSVKGDRHSGTDKRRDAKKMVHYAIEHLMWVEDELNNKSIDGEPISRADVMAELMLELNDSDREKYSKIISKG